MVKKYYEYIAESMSIGEILTVKEAYNIGKYIEEDVDLAFEIGKYESYIIKDVEISRIELSEEIPYDEEKIEDIISDYRESKKYLLPILDKNLKVIIGNNIISALEKIGIKKVKCIVGYD